jgi:hypothetical protein
MPEVEWSMRKRLVDANERAGSQRVARAGSLAQAIGVDSDRHGPSAFG